MGDDKWRSLHIDVLNEIAGRLFLYDDYARVRVVCKEWYSKLPKIPLQAKRNPWLVLPCVDETTVDTRTLQDKEIYHLMLPNMRGYLLRGSCFGWLIRICIYTGAILMINPLTNAEVRLPPISTFPNVTKCKQIYRRSYAVLDISTGTPTTVEKKEFHETQVLKVVASSPPNCGNDDFMAVAIYGEGCSLAFYKQPNTRWLDILARKERRAGFQDVIFFQDKVYAIDWRAQLYEFDATARPLPVGGIVAAALPQDLVVRHDKYLVGHDNGDLLMLVRYLKYACMSNIPRETYAFDIFRFNKNATAWSRIHSLGKDAIMIGLNSSIRMLAHTVSGVKGNRIYYTDNQVQLHRVSDYSNETGHDIGVINLEDQSRKLILPNGSFKFPCPPVWLLP